MLPHNMQATQLWRKFVKEAKKRIRGLTIAGVIVFLVPFIPSVISYASAWYGYAKWLFPYLVKVYRFIGTPRGYLLFGVLGIILVIWDQRRIAKPKKVKHDLDTLKGRTLALRDDMQEFLDKAPPKPKIDRVTTAGMTNEEIMDLSLASKREPKLAHGYQLHFEQRVRQVFHEFGERNITDNKLTSLMAYQIPNEDLYKNIIKRLTELSEVPEAAD